MSSTDCFITRVALSLTNTTPTLGPDAGPVDVDGSAPVVAAPGVADLDDGIGNSRWSGEADQFAEHFAIRLLVDFLFGPLEGGGVLIPASDKGFDRLDQHFDAGEAGSLQCAAAQNAKPAFHLIEPGAVCRDEMKMDPGMGFEPAILLGFMRIEIVQHNVNLFVRIFGYQLVHEIQKFASAPAPIMPCMHQPGRHLQGRKERAGAMALVFVCKAVERSTVGQANPALRPLQRLNVGLLIHAEHQSVLGRVQIEPNHINRFASALRIGAYTPTLPASQTQMVLSHYPPDLILAHLAQMLRQQSPVPEAVASRRRPIERLPHPLLAGPIIFPPLLTRPGDVSKAGDSVLSKPSQHSTD